MKKFDTHVRMLALNEEDCNKMCEILWDLGVEHNVWFPIEGREVFVLVFKCDLPTLRMAETFLETENTIIEFKKRSF